MTSRPVPSAADLRSCTTHELLATYADILTVLLERQVIRTRNAPAGDLAEKLVALAYNGRLAPTSAKSFDVELDDGTRLQVKSRVVDPGGGSGSKVYSPFRSWDFDRCIFIVFDSLTYDVQSATDVPAAGLRKLSSRSDWVAGDRIRVKTNLLGITNSKDVTQAIRNTLVTIDSLTAPQPGPSLL